MKFDITCSFVSADGNRTELPVNNVSEAQAAWESPNWRHEVARAETVTGQFPCVGFMRTDDQTTYLNISGEEDGRFHVMLHAVAKPGVLGIFGRESADIDVDGASADQVRMFIHQFFTLDKQNLCAWAKLVSQR